MSDPSSVPEPAQPYLALDVIPEEHRTNAVLLHLSPLAAFFLPMLGNVIGALVAWLLLRDRHRVLDEQGRQVVNFQISISLYFLAAAIILIPVTFLTFGIGLVLLGPILLGGLYLLQFVTMILAVVATLEGRPYRYPLSVEFIR